MHMSLRVEGLALHTEQPVYDPLGLPGGSAMLSRARAARVLERNEGSGDVLCGGPESSFSLGHGSCQKVRLLKEKAQRFRWIPRCREGKARLLRRGKRHSSSMERLGRRQMRLSWSIVSRGRRRKRLLWSMKRLQRRRKRHSWSMEWCGQGRKRLFWSMQRLQRRQMRHSWSMKRLRRRATRLS